MKAYPVKETAKQSGGSECTINRQDRNRNISVREAALRMGKTPSFVRVALQQGRLPFGTAVKLSTKWTYYINPAQFKQYLGETDSSAAEQAECRDVW